MLLFLRLSLRIIGLLRVTDEDVMENIQSMFVSLKFAHVYLDLHCWVCLCLLKLLPVNLFFFCKAGNGHEGTVNGHEGNISTYK